jgi:hypothetical protein
VSTSPLQSRAEELALSADDVREWEPQVAPDVVAALLANLIRFDESLRELSR